MTRRQARIWIRQHFAFYVLHSDYASGGETEAIAAVWQDEVGRITKRILAGSPSGDPHNQ